MTFTYTGNPSDNDLDAVRFLIGDTQESEPLLTDEEITFLNAQWTLSFSVYWTAAMACETIAARFAREVTFNSDSQTISTSELQDKYLKQAERLRVLHMSFNQGAGVIEVGGITRGETHDPTVKPLAFGRSMHDHYEAGEQDQGTYFDDPVPGGYDPLLGH